MQMQHITFGTATVYEKGRGAYGWPTDRITVRIDGVELCRKDGGPRKFKTKEAARKAALAEIRAINA